MNLVQPVRIPVGDRYEVRIGPAVLDELAQVVGPNARRVLLVHAPAVAGLAARLGEQLVSAGYAVVPQELPDAEAAKTTDTLAGLWSVLGQHEFTRTDVVVGLGGGATTDLAGFAAATWLRGVRVIQIPTTLLGMVDAAVGGKTGINTAEGKNLVGAFHEPAAVLVDPAVLTTLPQRDLVAGLAEVVKCGFIADPRILDLVEADPAAALDLGGPVLPELIRRAVEVKAEVVAADLTESALREILNYGHTFGHAVEQAEHYRWRHGDAVAVGMVFAAELAAAAGLLASEVVRRHRSVLESVGLPTSYSGGASFEDLLTAMRRDKKSRGSTLRFVVLRDVGRPERLAGPSPEQLERAWQAVHAAE